MNPSESSESEKEKAAEQNPSAEKHAPHVRDLEARRDPKAGTFRTGDPDEGGQVRRV